MQPDAKPLLLDVTRLISRSWTRRRSTGIDRVCFAYLRHYRASALAVVQHRGIIKVLDAAGSKELFDLLLGPDAGFRTKLVRTVPRLLLNALGAEAISGGDYINVSHTDFDLPQHVSWIKRHNLRAIYLLHDLIPILHPEYSRPHAVKRHTGRVQSALRHTDEIIVTSNAVAHDLKRYAAESGLPAPEPVVAPLAGEALRRLSVDPEHADSPHFVSIGTIEPRKNHALLIEVWGELVRLLGEDAPKLILVGQSGPMTGSILDPIKQDTALSQRIEWRKTCSDQEMAQLIAGARGVLCPSLAEGYGLPLVEALELGRPVLASDIAVFSEIGQGVPKLLSPGDRQAWVDAVLGLMQDTEASAPSGNEPRFTPPRWPDHFAQIDAVLSRETLDNAPAFASSLAA